MKNEDNEDNYISLKEIWVGNPAVPSLPSDITSQQGNVSKDEPQAEAEV